MSFLASFIDFSNSSSFGFFFVGLLISCLVVGFSGAVGLLGMVNGKIDFGFAFFFLLKYPFLYKKNIKPAISNNIIIKIIQNNIPESFSSSGSSIVTSTDAHNGLVEQSISSQSVNPSLSLSIRSSHISASMKHAGSLIQSISSQSVNPSLSLSRLSLHISVSSVGVVVNDGAQSAGHVAFVSLSSVLHKPSPHVGVKPLYAEYNVIDVSRTLLFQEPSVSCFEVSQSIADVNFSESGSVDIIDRVAIDVLNILLPQLPVDCCRLSSSVRYVLFPVISNSNAL